MSVMNVNVNDTRAPRDYGLRVGGLAGVFSIAQALVLYGAALGGYAAIASIQQGINIDNASAVPVVDFTLLVGPLLPTLFVSYGSMLVAGLITIWLSHAAGRMAAMRAGRHEGGARAGMWVWLISTSVWLVASVIVVVVAHRDGTISGVFSGTGKPEFTAQEVIFLLIQEVIAALIGLGFCALAGSRGANGAELVDPTPRFAPAGMATYPFAVYPPAPWMAAPPQLPQGYQMGRPPAGMAPGYPPAGAPGYQGYPGATYPVAGYPGVMYPPPAPWTPPGAVYPPPPSHYLPQQPPAPQPATQADTPATPSAAPETPEALEAPAEPAAGVSPQEPGA